MTSAYLVGVVGDGASPETAWRPDVPAGTPYVCVMLHEAKRRALIVSPVDAIAGATRLLQAADMDALRAKAAATSPTNAQLTAVNTWLTAAGFQPVAAGTWASVITAAARQTNPAADLDATTI